jgi:starch synthase
MIILSHSGKQHSYQVAKALNDLGQLDGFYTSSYITQQWLQDYLKKKGDTFWTRRFIDGLPGKKVHANWRFELPELLLRQWQGKSAAVQKAVYQRDENFDRYIAHHIIPKLRRKADSPAIYWGFQGSCYQSLQAAAKAGITSWCELATAHVVSAKKILGEEALLHPEWAATIDNLKFATAYEQRLTNEPHVADRVVAASRFTQQTLLDDGIAQEKIIYLPLGCDISYVPYLPQIQPSTANRPLRLLYAGTITQRKGIKYLLEAMKSFAVKDVELHLIGGIQGNNNALKAYDGLYTYHAPVSQQELFKLYGQFDALVLPTVFEGFGLVIVEAMAAGLPVITTPHSIGPELIEDDKNGYIIPIRNIKAIEQAITQLRNKSDQAYATMRTQAREAALGYSWEAYKGRLEEVLKVQSEIVR